MNPESTVATGARTDSPARRVIRVVALTVAGIVGYAICINMFSGYPEIGSQWINRAVIAGLVIAALVVFIRDERRGGDTVEPAVGPSTGSTPGATGSDDPDRTG